MDSTIGAIEIGTMLSGVLFGLITAQTYVYFRTFPEDSRFSKALVGALWIIELAHTACSFDALYMYTVRSYGNPASLLRFPLSLDTTVILHGATVIIVQLFFTHRIAKFIQKTYYLPALAMFILLVRFAAFIVSGVAALRMSDIFSFMNTWKSLILFDLISCAITDVMMSAILVYQLAQRRSNVYQRTLAVMDKLIMWSVETCVVTTFTTVTIMICFLTMGEKNFIWLGILLVQPKIFSNALLANLNSRSVLRDANSSHVHEMTPSRSIRFSPRSETFNNKSQPSQVPDNLRGTSTESPVEDKFPGPSTPVDGGVTHAIRFDSV
ncbi:hypothetical protein DFH06DRAFT_1245588 [Mycena polygramma]|nr:hypothetical protein DFH06DRAFT_1245588 [Mycena polygramma]